MPAAPTSAIPPAPAPTRPHAARVLTIVFALVFALVGIALYAARAQHPGPDSGEFWSDANVINGCRGYDQIGFSQTWGIPRIQLAAPITDTKALYLTYPPGPYWLSYAAWTVGRTIGLDPVLSARLFAQTCGLASGLLMFFLCTRLARSPAIGALAALFYILSPAFLSYSAALHHMAYSPMLLLGAMRAWLAFEDGARPRRWLWLALAALLFAIDCWTNLEHMVFFALFVGIRTAFHFRWPVVIGAALVGPLPIPMMALRVLHNAQVLGGWDAAMHKFRSSANRRSSGGRAGVDLSDLALTWLARLDFPVQGRSDLNLVWNQEFVYPALNPWVVAGLSAMLLTVLMHGRVRRRQAQRLPLSLIDPGLVTLPPLAGTHAAKPARLFLWTLPAFSPVTLGLANSLLLLAGGFTWFIVMTQHTQPHRFIVLLLMPGLALLLGALCWWVIDSARACTAGLTGPLAAWVRLRAWTLAALVLGVFAFQARRADVLNQHAILDPATHQRVTTRVEANQRAVALGKALDASGITRLHLYDGANIMPWRAATLALPFLYARQDMPKAIDPADAIYAEAWDATEIAACLDASIRFGLPDLNGPPDARTVVFRGSATRAGLETRLDLPLLAAPRPDQPVPPADSPSETPAPPSTPAAATPDPSPATPKAPPTLHSIRWAPTLQSDQFALTMLVTGDLDQSDAQADLDRFTFSLRVRDAQGQVVHESRTRLRWAGIRDRERALLIVLAPASVMVEGATADLAIWDRSARAPIVFSTAVSEPFATGESGRRLRWPAPAIPGPASAP